MDLVNLIEENEGQKKSGLNSIVESDSLKAVPDEKSNVNSAIPEYSEFTLMD